MHVHDEERERTPRLLLRAVDGSSVLFSRGVGGQQVVRVPPGPNGLDMICTGGRKPKGPNAERYPDFWD